MEMAPKFTLTNSSVTVIFEGKAYTFQEGTPNFSALRRVILDQAWDELPKCLTVASSIETWAKGNFSVDGDMISYKGDTLPQELNARIVAMASKGEDPTRLFKFWERMCLNPSHRSKESAFSFMQHVGIPLDENGWLVVYKSVRPDFLDHYTGTIDNHPGAHVMYDRNKVSDDPRTPCHEGLHVGALSYAQGFGCSDRLILICRVDPQHIVCVPYDESARKMRVCDYWVVGIYTGPLEDTSFDEKDAPTDDDYKAACDDYNGEDDYEGDLYEDSECDDCPDCCGSCHDMIPEITDFKVMDTLNESELWDLNLDILRKYAANHLKMVGASKIKGGKAALIARIVAVRKHY